MLRPLGGHHQSTTQLITVSRRHTVPSPPNVFFIHLTDQLPGWLENGSNIILILDANKDISAGPQTLKKMLVSKQLGVIDLIAHRTSKLVPDTPRDGSTQIDGVFVTSYVECVKARLMPLMLAT